MPNGPAGVMTVRHMHRHGQPSTDRRLEPIPPSIQVAKGSKTQHKRLDNMEHSTGIGIPNWQVPHTQPKTRPLFYKPNSRLAFCSSWTSIMVVTRNQWTHHSAIPSHSWTHSFHIQGEPQEEPEQCLHHTTVQVHETKVILTGNRPIAQPTKQKDPLTQLLATNSAIHGTEKWS